MLLRLAAAAVLLVGANPVLADASDVQRSDRWRLTAGCSTPFGRQTGLVADVIREQRRALGDMASIAEIGVRHDFGRGARISFGAGAGTGSPNAPRWRVVAGFEQDF